MEQITEQTVDLAGAANQGAVAFLANREANGASEAPHEFESQQQAQAPVVEQVQQQVVQQQPTWDPQEFDRLKRSEESYRIKADYLEAQQQILAQRLNPYLQFEGMVEQDPSLQTEIAQAIDKRRNPQNYRQAPAPQATPEAPAEAVNPQDAAVANYLRQQAERERARDLHQAKLSEDFYQEQLDRKVEQLTRQDPTFNPKLAAMVARQNGMEIRDLDKAWAIYKGIANPQAFAPQQGYQAPPQQQAPPPQYVQAMPAVRVPAPSARIPTTATPFVPRPGMPMETATNAALASWQAGTLHN